MVHTNRKVAPLEGGHSKKIGGIWTLKHEINSPKFYELVINNDPKGDNGLHLKNFYNHINMFLYVVPKLKEGILH